jgi:hypothetical protein
VEDLGPHGQHAGEERQRGTEAPGRDAHVVQLFGVLAQTRPRLLGAQDGQLAPHHRERKLAHCRRRGDDGGPEVGRTRDLHPDSQQAGLELGEVRRLQAARGAQLLHDRFEGLDPIGLHLDLDTPQLHRALSAAHDDDRVVERNLGHVDAAHAQREWPAAGTDLEHLAQPARARDGAQATAHGTFGPEVADAARRHDLGHLEPLAQPVPLRRMHVLHGHLDLAATVARARHEAGARHAPVVGVEVGVDEPPGRLCQRGHRAAPCGLDGERRQGGEPALHRTQVEGVELPLDFDGIGTLRCPFEPGLRHIGPGYCGARRPPRGAIECREFHARFR